MKNQTTETRQEEIVLDLRLAERLKRFLDKQERTITPLDKWLTQHEVLDILGIKERTLETLRTNGTLPSSKLANKLFYKQSDIENLLEDRYQMRRLRNPKGYGAERF